MSSQFGNIFGGEPQANAIDALLRAAEAKKNPKPLPQIRGKEIDGVLYVRAADMADALEVLSATTNKRLIDKLRAKR